MRLQSCSVILAQVFLLHSSLASAQGENIPPDLLRENGGSSFANFITIRNTYLSGVKILFGIKVESDLFCGRACLRHPSCGSANMAAKPDPSDSKYVCELLGSSKYTSPENMRSIQDWNHLSITSACGTAPCLHGGTCLQIAYNGVNPYTCVCALNYTGEHCQKACIEKALGMENRNISDDQITVSSKYGDWGGARARLNLDRYSWQAAYGHINDKQWLEVDFRKVVKVTGTSGSSRYVKAYTVGYSLDGVTWRNYTEGGEAKLFVGNTKPRNSIATNTLGGGIQARLLQINVKDWNVHIEMRVEFYGCPT